jgi:hypothetical protein
LIQNSTIISWTHELFQNETFNHQSSIINCQLSIIHIQSAISNHQSAIINHQSRQFDYKCSISNSSDFKNWIDQLLRMNQVIDSENRQMIIDDSWW